MKKRLNKRSKKDAERTKKICRDGWAIWIDGEDISNVYLNDRLNPKGKSCVVIWLEFIS